MASPLQPVALAIATLAACASPQPPVATPSYSPSAETSVPATTDVELFCTPEMQAPPGTHCVVEPPDPRRAPPVFEPMDPSAPPVSLTSDQIEQVVRYHAVEVRRQCFERGAPGSINQTVQVTISGDGSVARAVATGDDDSAGKCLEAEIPRWRFQPTGGKTTVNLPFHAVRAPEVYSASDAPFDVAAATAALRAVDVSECQSHGNIRGRGRVVVFFNPDGKTSGAWIESEAPFDGSDIGGCILFKFRAAKVPAFRGHPMRARRAFVLE